MPPLDLDAVRRRRRAATSSALTSIVQGRHRRSARSPVTAAPCSSPRSGPRRHRAARGARRSSLGSAARLRRASTSPRPRYDRPRPPGRLVDTERLAYPSGHAAYAVALVACAIVLVRARRRLGDPRRRSSPSRSSLAVVVAATRVYLRAHYLTDVLGGARARRRDLVARRRRRAGRRDACATMTADVSNDDQITYLVAGAAAGVSLDRLGWRSSLVPAWRSYWRVLGAARGDGPERLRPRRVRARRARGVGAAVPLVLLRTASEDLALDLPVST